MKGWYWVLEASLRKVFLIRGLVLGVPRSAIAEVISGSMMWGFWRSWRSWGRFFVDLIFPRIWAIFLRMGFGVWFWRNFERICGMEGYREGWDFGNGYFWR